MMDRVQYITNEQGEQVGVPLLWTGLPTTPLFLFGLQTALLSFPLTTQSPQPHIFTLL